MKGNEALAEAAIRAGCKCFFGYPITPQTELSAYMAKKMQKAAADLNFEAAAEYRDKMVELKKMLQEMDAAD